MSSVPPPKRATAKKKKKNSTPSLRDCAECGAPEGSIPGIPTHNACGRCRVTFYCSVKCQQKHWKYGGHKLTCVRERDRKVKGIKDGTPRPGKASASEEECAICLDALSYEPAQTLPCSHIYHARCILRLRAFGINQACPLCREKLPPGPPQLYEDAMGKYIKVCRRYDKTETAQWLPTTPEDTREMNEVRKLLQDAADQGLVEAQYNLGMLFSNGRGLPQDIPKAVALYEKAANGGLPEAQFNIGNAYYCGRGVPENHVTAANWFRKAAEAGDEDGMLNYANAFYKGEGVKQDLPTAVEWWKKSAALNSHSAQYYLGFMYHKGRGIQENQFMAAYWWKKAIEQEDGEHIGESQCRLGLLYFTGEGVPKDCEKAVRLLYQAKTNGVERAGRALPDVMRHAMEEKQKQNFASSRIRALQKAAESRPMAEVVEAGAGADSEDAGAESTEEKVRRLEAQIAELQVARVEHEAQKPALPP